MASHGPIVDALMAEARAEGQDLVAWGLAWARVLPTVLLVPAFGLGVLPAVLRVAIAFGLAVSIAPALAVAAPPVDTSWSLVVLREVARGVPVAVAAAAAVFAAIVAGGVGDVALGTSRLRPGSLLGPAGGPMATLFGLLAGAIFFETGGATRVASRLSGALPSGPEPLGAAARDLAAGIGVGATIGAPLLVASVVVDLAGALAARELPSIRTETLVAPLRTLVVLVAAAVLFDRTAEALAVLSLAGR